MNYIPRNCLSTETTFWRPMIERTRSIQNTLSIGDGGQYRGFLIGRQATLRILLTLFVTDWSLAGKKASV